MALVTEATLAIASVESGRATWRHLHRDVIYFR